MFEPLRDLSDEHRIGLALLAIGIPKYRRSVCLDLNQLDSKALSFWNALPRSWQLEWAVAQIQQEQIPKAQSQQVETKSAASELVARAYDWERAVNTTHTAQLFLYLPRRSGATVANLRSSIFGVLRLNHKEIEILLLNGAVMTAATADTKDIRNQQLEAEVYLGQMTLTLDDLIRLQQGEQLSCPLPNVMRAHVTLAGGDIAEGTLRITKGQILLELRKLSEPTSDYSKPAPLASSNQVEDLLVSTPTIRAMAAEAG